MSLNIPLDLVLTVYSIPSRNTISNNFINPNEVRVLNNMNSIIDSTIDTYLENMYERVLEDYMENDEDEQDEEEEQEDYDYEVGNRMGVLMYEAIIEDRMMQERRMEDRIMRMAMEQSLNYYQTQEKKPNIKLNIESKKATNDLVQEKCAICTSEFEVDENVTFLNCDHVLHTECINEWVMYKSECPICRGKIDTISDTTSLK